MATFPPRLKKGSHIRVIAPATSVAVLNSGQKSDIATKLKNIGLTISFGDNAEICDAYNSSPIKARVDDLHNAFLDPQVDGILSNLGGYNSNQLLQYLDFELIRRHPKVFCGFSDITALSVAFLVQSNLVTYSGPHYATFSRLSTLEYTLEYFQKCLFTDAEFEVRPSPAWTGDLWNVELNKADQTKNDGFLVLNPGEGSGTILGGNLCTLNLLQGTKYMPSLKDSILFLEDDYESSLLHFDRDLQSLIHQPEFDTVRGLVIGRFEPASKITVEMLQQLVSWHPELQRIPVIAEADFGHTSPMFTYPIGGTCKISASHANAGITIVRH